MRSALYCWTPSSFQAGRHIWTAPYPDLPSDDPRLAAAAQTLPPFINRAREEWALARKAQQLSPFKRMNVKA